MRKKHETMMDYKMNFKDVCYLLDVALKMKIVKVK